MSPLPRCLAGLLLLVCSVALSERLAEAPLTTVERSRILALGPWPPPPALDPGNRVAGRAEAIVLGQRLFFDARLSADGTLACASCHLPALAFTDGRAAPPGSSGERCCPTIGPI